MSVVVVIDPGHGGDNLGGNTDEFIEKELTLKVAFAMRDRLSEYEDVEVYLTHDNTTDPDLGRKERAAIAKDHNADLFISLHFNMSENHDLYGAEVWTSAFGKEYSEGTSFATIEMEALTDGLGFFDRGIKTRLGDDGTDYYGIIKYGREAGIPSVIIEHCHMDESRDYDFLHEHGEESYTILGQTDADSVAKYFRLKSDSLGLDYSDYAVPEVGIPDQTVSPDETDPEECGIELLDADTKEGTALVKISAYDSGSIIQYYRYSLDGGLTFSKLLPWNDDINALRSSEKEYINAKIELVEGKESELIVRAYNRYDKFKDSNTVTLPAMEERVIEPDVSTELLADEQYDEIITVTENTDNDAANTQMITILGLGVAVSVAALITVLLLVFLGKRKKKRRGRKNKSRR